MRLLMLVLIASSMFAQVGAIPPTVRDAYTLSGSGEPRRVARLGGDLRVVVCKDEYDAWRTTNPKADLALFLVGSSLAMPDFDSTLLALMGISNGTYLGFKLQGK